MVLNDSPALISTTSTLPSIIGTRGAGLTRRLGQQLKNCTETPTSLPGRLFSRRAGCSKKLKYLHERVDRVEAVGEETTARIHQLQTLVETATVAVEQQSQFVAESGEGIQIWQEETQVEVENMHNRLVDCAEKMEDLESKITSVPSQEDIMTKVWTTVEHRLKGWEEHMHSQLEEWTATTTKGCQELEDKVESQGDLCVAFQVVESRQKSLQLSVDAVFQRLEHLAMWGWPADASPSGPFCARPLRLRSAQWARWPLHWPPIGRWAESGRSLACICGGPLSRAGIRQPCYPRMAYCRTACTPGREARAVRVSEPELGYRGGQTPPFSLTSDWPVRGQSLHQIRHHTNSTLCQPPGPPYPLATPYRCLVLKSTPTA